MFHHVPVNTDRKDQGHSWLNPVEAVLVVKYAKMIVTKNVTSLGVITPYKAQVKEIRRMLKLANLKIEVGTAEEYQGREVDAMIARVHY